MDLPNHRFLQPTKRIITPEDLALFHTSPCKANLVGFILALQASVKSRPRSATPQTPSCLPVMQLLDTVSQWADQVPPIAQPMRFGNRAFTTFQRRVESDGPAAIQTLLLSKPEGAQFITNEAPAELSVYLSQSFGDPIRIDYGTGHELNFLSFLLVLTVLGYFTETDRAAVVHHVFVHYMALMRKLQRLYNHEPAGSHGVWGLDDYHFLPFLFGAAELCGSGYRPDVIHDDSVVNHEAENYMYLNCIKFIKEVKRAGHFGEHSPMLNDISGLASWEKVAQGLVKMYQQEVLNKHPVMKHFFFGSIIDFSP